MSAPVERPLKVRMYSESELAEFPLDHNDLLLRLKLFWTNSTWLLYREPDDLPPLDIES